MSLLRLKAKLKRHPALGKARLWAWVAPGNVPDPIKLAVISARLQKAELILKLSRRNQKTGRAIVRKYASANQKIHIVADPRIFAQLAARAGVWVVYGSDATLRSLRASVPPGAAWIGHGHRISLSVIFASSVRTRAALSRTAKACARDIYPHDQLGCLSPQIIWVQGDAGHFASALQKEMQRLESSRGRPRRDSETIRMRRSVLEEIQIRALNPLELKIIQGTKNRKGAPVVYRLNRGKFITPAGAQIVAVKSFQSAADISRGMQPFLRHLQGIAVDGTSAERAQTQHQFQHSSAVYFCRPGRLQSPPIDWQL